MTKNNTIYRNASVEYLRVLFMLCIVVLHSIGYREGGAGLLPMCGGSIVTCIRYGIQGLCHIGVSGFIFISGYYGIKFKWYKLWNIWTQALFYSVILAALSIWIWDAQWVRMIMYFFMPISRSEWFLMDYVVVVLLAPFIQAGIYMMSRKQFLGIIIFLSVMLYIGRFASFDRGTSFLLMLDVYLIGRYLRTYPVYFWEDHASGVMIVALAGLFLLPFGCAMIGYPKWLRLVLSNYNILALMASASMVMLADKHLIRTRWSVNLGANVLAVFLVTEQVYMREWLWGGAFAKQGLAIRILIILTALFGCMLIDQVRQWTIVPLTDRIYGVMSEGEKMIRNEYEKSKDNSMLP